MSIALNPHAKIAFIQIDSQTGKEVVDPRTGEPAYLAVYDSWRDKSLFLNVDVELTTNQASAATWGVFDPDFALLNKWTRTVATKKLPVRVWLGCGEDLGEPVFKGLLARVERGTSNTSFHFYDMGFVMRRVKKSEYHKGLNDVGIIKKLAERNGLKFEGPNPSVKLEAHKSLMQDGATDWEHAVERAADAGLVLYVRGDTLFAKEAVKTRAFADLTLVYKQDFALLSDFALAFKLPESQDGRSKTVEARGRGRGGRRLKGHAHESARGTEQIELKRDLSISSKRHANARAHARKQLQREHAFVCSVTMLPDAARERVDIRDTIELKEVGDMFIGRYLVDKVLHRLSPGEIRTQLDLYRDFEDQGDDSLAK